MTDYEMKELEAMFEAGVISLNPAITSVSLWEGVNTLADLGEAAWDLQYWNWESMGVDPMDVEIPRGREARGRLALEFLERQGEVHWTSKGLVVVTYPD